MLIKNNFSGIAIGRVKPMVIEEVKDELKQLCTDYLNILQELKNQEIINEELFEKYSVNKKSFLEE